MADLELSTAPLVTFLGDSDRIPLLQAGAGKPATMAQLKTYLLGAVPQRTYLTSLSGVVQGIVSASQRATNTSAINSALALGTLLYMRAGEYVEISSSLNVKSNGGIICEKGGIRPIIYCPAAQFNNVNISFATRYGTNAVGINCSDGLGASQQSNIMIAGIALQFEVMDARACFGIAALRVKDLLIDDVEIFGMALGTGVNVATISGNSQLRNLYIHDFYTNHTGYAATANINGIKIDDDRIGGVPSDGLRVINPRIHDMLCGSAFIMAYSGYQSDGICVAGMKSASAPNPTINLEITGFDIRRCGEAIDDFGHYTRTTNGIIDTAYIFGLKKVHGGSFGVTSNVIIRNAALAGIVLAGQSSASVGCTDNQYTNILIENIDPSNLWFGSSTAGINLGDIGNTLKVSRNTFTAVTMRGTPNGIYGWLDTSTGAAGDNVGEGLDITGFSGRRVYSITGGGSCRLKGSTTYHTNLT